MKLVLTILLGTIGSVAVVALGLWLWLLFCKTLGSFNILFTIVQEGTIKVIVRAGKFRKAIIRFEGHSFDTTKPLEHPERWEVIDKPQEEKWWQKWTGGLYWIGIPFYDRVYTYTLTSYEKGPEGKAVKKSQSMDYVHAQTKEFDWPAQEFWTEDKVPVLVDYAILVRITNPYKALFEIANYWDAVLDLVQAHFRRIIVCKEVEELLKITPEDIKIDPSKDAKFDGLQNDYGVCVISARVLEINPKNRDVVEAMQAIYEAQQEKEKIETLAKAEAERIRIVAEAEGKREETVGKGRAVAARLLIEEAKKDPCGPETLWADAASKEGGVIANLVKQAVRVVKGDSS